MLEVQNNKMAALSADAHVRPARLSCTRGSQSAVTRSLAQPMVREVCSSARRPRICTAKLRISLWFSCSTGSSARARRTESESKSMGERTRALLAGARADAGAAHLRAAADPGTRQRGVRRLRPLDGGRHLQPLERSYLRRARVRQRGPHLLHPGEPY